MELSYFEILGVEMGVCEDLRSRRKGKEQVQKENHNKQNKLSKK